MKKSIPELKAEFVRIMCGEEKKSNSFEIHVIILKYVKNVNLPFKKILNLQDFFPKHPFSVRDRLENGEGKKQRRRQKYVHKNN